MYSNIILYRKCCSVYEGSLEDKPTFLFTVLENLFYLRNLSESKFSSVEHLHIDSKSVRFFSKI